GDGKDKWPWIDKTPQVHGWHDDPGTPEFVPVASASHPVNSIGRSHKAGKQPGPDDQDPILGTYFQEQWGHALRVDPEFIFITGWNEWVAQRFIFDKKERPFADGKIKNGDTWFIDQYSIEYSRDCEPMRGGFEDNYYYQLASNIRKFKGVRPQPEVCSHWNIEIDGRSNDWNDVEPECRDDVGDTRHRDHPGYASAGPYKNDWGRNDIVSCKVARDEENVYFSVKTANDLVVPALSDPGWMNLLVRIAGLGLPDWEGYHYRIVPVATDGLAAVCAWRNDRWRKVMEIPCIAGSNFVELALPLGKSGANFQPLEIEFKWIDHMPEPFTVLDFMDHGDAAPNNRFRYAYKYKKENNE
ncbi:MAG: hypothetical protein U9P12_09090, partial [Verrucomicrobiota bacterium]|nr:hypothetical protein [Verrucomicrobiota bacterium]